MKSAVVCLHRRFRSTYCDAIGLNMTASAITFLLRSSSNLKAMEIYFHNYISYYLDQWILEYFLLNRLR